VSSQVCDLQRYVARFLGQLQASTTVRVGWRTAVTTIDGPADDVAAAIGSVHGLLVADTIPV